MAEEKNSIIVYADWIDKFEDLTDEEAGKLIKHFFRYVNDLNPVLEDRILKMAFHDIQKSLKRDLKKWEDKKGERSESGVLGNLKRWHIDVYEKHIKGEITLNEALNIAESRKKSLSDNSESLSSQTSLLTVSVSDTVINNNVRAEQFEIFWKFYPKKVAKAKCKSKFMKLKESEVKEISKTIISYVAYKPFESYTHPNPETYLNQKRWEDEIPTNQPKNNSNGIEINLALN